MKNPKAMTLIELLAVVAILAMLMAILLPSVSQSYELSKRTACASNLRGIGQAFYIYAQDAPNVFPTIAGTYTNTPGMMHLFYPQDRTTAPPTTGIPSPTVDMWSVVRQSYTQPKQFVCPSTTDLPDPAADTTAYYDFSGMDNLSYGYQYQHHPNRRVIGMTSEPTFPIVADGNPYIKGGVTGISIQSDRLSAARGNSTNHPNRLGQNVLFQDNRVVFETGPDVGLPGRASTVVQTVSRGRDHCYTTHLSSVNAIVDPGDEAPQWTSPESAGMCDLGGKSDACLVP